MTRKQSDFERFDNAITDLLKVPHSEIKAKLDAEKAEKEKKAKPKKQGRKS